MNKHYVLALMAAASLAACSKNDDNNTTPPPTTSTDTVMVRNTISANTTWSKNKVYVLRGYVYVDAPAKLTIEAGTKIISYRDSAGVLVVYKGAKIDANGTTDNPIVFTSGHADAKPGDLGGVILVGNATGNGNHSKLEGGVDAAHNQFGGTDDADNSGSLTYTRIEYGGKAVAPNDEINGLTLYAVGSGTTLHHIQILNGLDDAIEIFGGTANLKYIIAYNNADDDFDFDDGYRGKIQYAVSIKQPTFTDTKTGGDVSNNFEVDNTNPSTKPITSTPITAPVLSNFTAIGPGVGANVSKDYGYGMRWRRGSKFTLGNSIVANSYLAALRIDDQVGIDFYTAGDSKFVNSLLHSAGTESISLFANGAVVDAAALTQLVTGRDLSVVLAAGSLADLKLKDPTNNANPDLVPQTGSPALAGAKFEGSLNDAFFDKVAFRGAVDPANDWTKAKWVSWNRIVK
ncbi:hypothetical protein [Chitinophaga sp. CB10]|uniref:hypothetical protein n=1 Tax=Chitinophaga sp. CB10 TaxID=1891659 RepID=UPI000AA497CD|nr:hypothetical protein [Chitinophaga sp. CB10]